MSKQSTATAVQVMKWREESGAYSNSGQTISHAEAVRQQSFANGRYDRPRRQFFLRPWPSAAHGIEIKTYLLLLQEHFPAPSGFCYALQELQEQPEDKGRGRWTCQGLILITAAAQHVDACRADWVGLTYTAHEPPRFRQPRALQVVGTAHAAVVFRLDAAPEDESEWLDFMTGERFGGSSHHGGIRIRAREHQEKPERASGPLREDHRNPKHWWRRLLRELGQRYPHMPRRLPGEHTDSYHQRLYGFLNTLEGADCFARNRFGGKAEAQANRDYAEKRKTVPNA